MTTSDYIRLGKTVHDMAVGVLNLTAGGQDTAFALQQIETGHGTLHVFVAAPEAAKAFEQAADKAFDVQEVPIEPAPKGGSN